MQNGRENFLSRYSMPLYKDSCLCHALPSQPSLTGLLSLAISATHTMHVLMVFATPCSCCSCALSCSSHTHAHPHACIRCRPDMLRVWTLTVWHARVSAGFIDFSTRLTSPREINLSALTPPLGASSEGENGPSIIEEQSAKASTRAGVTLRTPRSDTTTLV